MKDIEKLIKDSLENHELPYDSSAWNNLSSKLPKTKVVPRINFTKWAMLGFGAATLAISTFLVFTPETNKSNQTVKKQSKEIEKTTSKVENKKTTLPEENLVKTNPKTNKSASNTTDNKISLNTIKEVNQVKNPNENTLSITATPQDNTFNKLNTTLVPLIEPLINRIDKVVKNELKTPSFLTKCQGETIEWENSNVKTIVLKTPSGDLELVRSKEQLKITLNQSGYYSFNSVDQNGELVELKSFKVINSPSISLNFDTELTYENGLPTLKANLETEESKIRWSLNNETIDNFGKNAVIYAFNKGAYELTAIVTNEVACKSTESKTIQIREDYNLLAVNAFDPNSTDNRKTTFLPVALQSRTSPFKMTIFDPNDGGVVFETSDSYQPWDGIDKRDGKIVNSNKVYIWKVILKSPEKDEKSEYKGTIIRI